jgi:phosphoribosylformimino-5-aminoimidazole carboxamide ribonucleotide (ProFAR) isomerase
LDWALGTGAARAVLASSALADPDLVARAIAGHGERVVVAVDVRDGRVVSRGTEQDLGPLEEVLSWHPVSGSQVRRVLVADASRDGTRTGSDLGLFARVAQQVQGQVTASGGVSSLADLRALAQLHPRVTAVVLGSALYHSAFTVEQALEVCR